MGATLGLVVLCSACTLAQEKPPAPKKPVTNLKMPAPVIVEAQKGEATLSQHVKLGFALDLADKILGGNWDVKGKVATLEAEKVSFITDQGENGNLVFSLPGKLTLSIAAGEPLSIKRTSRGYGAVLGYELVMTSSEKVVIAAGLLFGEMPQQVKIIEDDFALEQSQKLGQALSESKYETTYHIPVTLITDGRNIQLPLGEAQEVTIQGKKYEVVIQQSSKVVPTKEYEGVAEGSGYALEYVVISK